MAAPLDGRLGRQLERPKMLAGRPPLPGRADEVMVDQLAARVLGLHVGSVLRLAALNNQPEARCPLPHRARGRHRGARDSIVPVNKLAQTAYIQASYALYRELGAGYQAFDGDYVKLAAGTTVGTFTAEATHLAREPRYRSSTHGQLFVADDDVQAATAERAIRPQAVALAIFALVLAVTALLILGQAASRLVLASSADNPVVAALGLTRWQLLAASLLQVLDRGRRRCRLGLRRRRCRIPADADRTGSGCRAASRRFGRCDGACRGIRRDRRSARRPARPARLARVVGLASQRGESAGGARLRLARGPPAGGLRRARDRGHRCPDGAGARPEPPRGPRERRDHRHGAGNSGVHGVGHLRCQPGPSGTDAAALREDLGCRDGLAVRGHRHWSVRPVRRGSARA